LHVGVGVIVVLEAEVTVTVALVVVAVAVVAVVVLDVGTHAPQRIGQCSLIETSSTSFSQSRGDTLQTSTESGLPLQINVVVVSVTVMLLSVAVFVVSVSVVVVYEVVVEDTVVAVAEVEVAVEVVVDGQLLHKAGQAFKKSSFTRQKALRL
jgi:hypothetical protein